MLRWLRFVRAGHGKCFCGLRCYLLYVKDRDGDSKGHTIHSGDGSGAMGHAIPSILRTFLPSIPHSTMGHSIRPNIRYIPTDRRTLHSTMGRSIRNISTDCNSKNSSMDCNACSSTMNCRCCMGRNSIRSCSQDPISSRKDSPRRLRPCLLPSGHIESWPRSFPVSLWCPSCLRKDR